MKKKPRFEDKSSESGARERDKPAGWVKHGQVWRSSKAQTGSQAKTSASRQEAELEAYLPATTGPGGYSHFNDIPAHRLGRALRTELYKLANNLPEEENLNLKQRIKFAATTVTASLASGFGQGTFRAGLGGALESRAALYSIQDHLQHLADQQIMSQDDHTRLHKEVDQVVSAINQFLGQLTKDRNKLQGS